MVGHEVDEERGIVKLLVPRFRASWMQWLQKRLKKPHIRVGLDEVGSAVWLLIDGNRTVLQIGEKMVKRFGEKMEPVGERLGLVLGTLRRNKFIAWDDAAAAEPPPEETPIEPR